MKKIVSLALVLSLVAFFAVTVKNVRADNATSTASVTNVAPVSSAVSIDGDADSITLTEATHTHVTVTATVTDTNGCADITGVTAKIFRTGVTNGATCTPDDGRDCYTPVAMTTSDCSDTVAHYTGDIQVQYYADPTDAGTYIDDTWSAHVIPSDAGGAGTAGTDDTIEMATLTALNVSSPIAYGELALDAITADTTAFDTTVTNTGNKASIGVQVNSGAATSMTCTTGTIPVGNEKYDDVSTTVYGSKIALTAGAETVVGVAAASGTTGNTDTVGWGLHMPSTGVRGSCTGTVVFTAI